MSVGHGTLAELCVDAALLRQGYEPYAAVNHSARVDRVVLYSGGGPQSLTLEIKASGTYRSWVPPTHRVFKRWMQKPANERGDVLAVVSTAGIVRFYSPRPRSPEQFASSFRLSEVL